MFQQKDMPHMQGMATSNQDQGTQTNGADEEQVAIDPNQKVTVADSTKDINITPPPPRAGDYPVQWSLAEKDATELRASKSVGTFVQCHFIGKLIAEGTEYHGFQVDTYMNSIYDKLRGTTPVHDFLHKVGHTVPAELSQGELEAFIKNALAQNPIGTATIEWNATYKDPTDKRANNKGYVTIRNKMTQFPRNQDGSYSNVVPSPLDNSPLFARAYVFAHLKK